MARVLAIETSGRTGSVALSDGAHIFQESQFPHGLKHAAEIVPIIDRLCSEHAWRPPEIEQVHVSAGPGSFTGLRIGITLAKTMAFATGAKLVAVPSVHVLAENAPPEAEHLIIVLDAKRGQIFTARFHRVAGGWNEVEPAHLDRLSEMLGRSPRPVHLLGEGIPFHRDAVDAAAGEAFVCPEESWRARAAAVVKIGTEMAGRGEFVDPYVLAPIYIRPPEAEEKWDAQHRA